MFDVDDDELDFAPTAGSKLASVFGQEKTKENGNPSLVYTPPKKPKPMEQFSETQQNPATKPLSPVPRFSVIIADIVHSFKLDSSVYSDQRKVGVAVLGNAQAHVFQILLYRTTPAGKQDYIAVAKITNEFNFLVQPKFYCSFYDDAKNYWSLVFNCQEACMQFSRQVGAARFRAIHGKAVVTQMIDPGDEGTSQGETTNLTISQEYFDINAISAYTPMEATIKVSLNPSQAKWSEGLVSASQGSKWAIFIPASMSLPWASDVSESPLVLEVIVEKMLQMSSPMAAECVQEKATSGSEEGSVQSLAESCSNNASSSKANLLSRVARLGQATLPLKGAVNYNPSDSEDTEEENSSITTANSAAKPPLKPKFAKGRSAGTPRASSESEPTYTAKPAAPVASTVWRPGTVMNTANKLVQFVPGDGQIVPMTSSAQQYQLVTTASPVTSPSEPMGMFISESRIQNTELRMNISRIADKIDTLSTKVDTISNVCATRPAVSSAIMDASTLLSSVEKLVRDNQILTTEVAEKNEKLAELNERIFSLVDNNSRLLDQNRVLLEEKQRAAEAGDAQTVVVQKTQIEALENEKSALLKRIAELENRLEGLRNSNSDLNRSKMSELSAKDDELSSKLSELSVKDSELSDLRSALIAKEAELNATITEFDKFRSLTQQDVSRLKEAEEKAKRYESDNEELKELVTSLSVNINELESTVTNLSATHAQEKTSFENQKKTYEEAVAQLKTQLAEAGGSNEVDLESTVMDLKVLMNRVYRKISQYFEGNNNVSVAVVRQAVAIVLKSEVTQYIEELLLKKTRLPVKTNLPADSEKAASPSPALKEPPLNSTVAAVSPIAALTERSASSKPEEAEAPVEPRRSSESHSISSPPPRPVSSDPGIKTVANVSGAEEVRPRNEFWRSEPPPVPKFEDEEDNEDWLNV